MPKREIVTPEKRINTVQALVDYLIDNGMSDWSANQFLHINMPALGGYRNILDCVREGDWTTAWTVVERYIAGDYF